MNVLHGRRSRQCALILCGIASLIPAPLGAVEFPGRAPGAAKARLAGGRLVFENTAFRVTWNLAPGHTSLIEIANRLDGKTLHPGQGELFLVQLVDGTLIRSSQLRAVAEPKLERIEPRADTLRGAEKTAGWKASVTLASADRKFEVVWEATLHDGAHYVRQQVVLHGNDPSPAEIVALSLNGVEVSVAGEVDGSPLVAGNTFLACEHPMARNRVEGRSASCSVRVFAPPRADRPARASAVLGVVPPGQMRRAFLCYLERERARPYKPFVNYISWFDIAAPDLKMNADQCLDVIHAFGRELAVKRGVRLDGFVFDDGWDDNQTLWEFHSGFPRGFAPLREAAEQYGAILGTWISPFGGYGKHKVERVEAGRRQGFETNRSGFSLAGPKYYSRFRQVCADMIRRFGVGYLKFDGIGSGGPIPSGPGPGCEGDLAGMLRLFEDLRAVRADLFINATTGTWPSPYWLFYSDTVWRGGEDVGYSGVGTKRQQWMTYRDGLGYGVRTRRGPLYPFNSLKFQSVMCARLSLAAQLGRDRVDLEDDIRMAAASGTQLQEFFVTPAMLEPWAWDAIAEAAGWVQRNADVLADSHGIGGDPVKGEVYGFASWSPRLGIVALRNPAARPAEFLLDVGQAFELPPGAARSYTAQARWGRTSPRPKLELEAGRPQPILLAPFEVLVLEAARR